MVVAIEHSMSIATWNMLKTGTIYNDVARTTTANPIQTGQKSDHSIGYEIGYMVTLQLISEAV